MVANYMLISRAPGLKLLINWNDREVFFRFAQPNSSLLELVLFFLSLLDPQGEDAQGRANSLFSSVRLIYFTKELTQRCSRRSKPFVQPCSAYPFHQLPRARLSKQALLSLARLIFQRQDQRARPSQPFAQPCPADLSTPRSTSKAEQTICSALLG